MSRYNQIPTTLGPNPTTNSQDRIPRLANSKYPSIPRSVNDIYVYTTTGDRYDILAQQYYNDSSLWWIISTANAFTRQDSLLTPPEIQIRIPSPSRLNEILSAYKSLNSLIL